MLIVYDLVGHITGSTGPPLAQYNKLYVPRDELLQRG